MACSGVNRMDLEKMESANNEETRGKCLLNYRFVIISSSVTSLSDKDRAGSIFSVTMFSFRS